MLRRRMLVFLTCALLGCDPLDDFSPLEPRPLPSPSMAFEGTVTSAANGEPVWFVSVVAFTTKEEGGFSSLEAEEILPPRIDWTNGRGEYEDVRWGCRYTDSLYVQAFCIDQRFHRLQPGVCLGFTDSERVAFAAECPEDGVRVEIVDFVLDPVPPLASGR